jgi:hypothetical protein
MEIKSHLTIRLHRFLGFEISKYWDAHAAERIADALQRTISR